MNTVNKSAYGDEWKPPPECKGTFTWLTSSGGIVPSNAVVAGSDTNGEPLYAGRAFHGGDLLPAKISPTRRCAYVSNAGNEFIKTEYEVLCSNDVTWKPCQKGVIPLEAIKIGQTTGGEHLFMGRAMVNGVLTPGKISPAHGCLFVPFEGRELRFGSYDVLVLQ